MPKLALFSKALSMPHKTVMEVELEFTKMLAARLLMKLEGKGDFLSAYDHEALKTLRECDPQEIAEADFEWIALDHWEELNPGYEYASDFTG